MFNEACILKHDKDPQEYETGNTSVSDPDLYGNMFNQGTVLLQKKVHRCIPNKLKSSC